MKPETILNADLLDILFENRNKDYGAYDLRRAYQKRLLKAVMGMLLLVLSLFLWSFWKDASPEQASRILTFVDDPKLQQIEVEKEKPKLPEPPRPVETIRNPTPIVVPDDQADPPPPTQQDLDKDAQIGLETIHGDSLSKSSNLPPADSAGTGKELVVEPEIPKGPVFHAEFMPEYPGGDAAMQRFLHKNLRFEFDDLQPGSKVAIQCRFVVDEEGNVTGIQIIKKGTDDFDKEVMRVVGKMPKWKPGSQNGRNVAVYFTLPVIVQVPEE